MSTITNPTAAPTLDQLRGVRDRVQADLDIHRPGWTLDWAVGHRPQQIPAHCLALIEQAGPAILDFYRAANTIFYRTPWVRRLVEKRYHPNYRRLNDAQPDAIPLNPRPDVVPDEQWNPKFVELEMTVGGRSDSALMGRAFGLPQDHSTVQRYVEMLRRRGLADQTVALVSAYHPAYSELADDVKCFASLVRAAGGNVEALCDDDLPYLSYRDRKLQCLRPGHRFEFTHFDRFIDIFEIAEVAHAGMRPLLDAYLDGVAIDFNTCKQFLDEKIWLALFWDARLADEWRTLLSAEHHDVLQRILPFTVILAPETQVRVADGWLPLERLHELPAGERRFVTKESGTSETAAAAQSFVVLSELSREECGEHLARLSQVGPPSILQDLVESAKIDFHALDPDTGAIMHQRGARVKMSAFYIDGALADLLFISSNKQYAVHNEGFMETVVAR